MNIFWFEFLHFVAYIFAVLICISSVALFLWTVNKEGTLRTKWRAIGFFSMGVACFLFILERKFGSLGLTALIFELLGFAFIYKGVNLETDLSHLQKKKSVNKKWKHQEMELTKRNAILYMKEKFRGIDDGSSDKRDFTFWYLVIAIFLIIATGFVQSPFIRSVTSLVSIFFILATIRIQIQRYQESGKSREVRLQNIYPLVGYVFLLFRQIVYVLYRLPRLKIVDLDQLTVDFGPAWFLGVFFALMGFAFLGIWAWNFIKLRVFLRTYAVISALAIFVATSSSLANALLAFQVIERNNLDLMAKGARLQMVLMTERGNVAKFVARTIADDYGVISAMQERKVSVLTNSAENFFENSETDIVRFYDGQKNIIASPSDVRDQGRTILDDEILNLVYEEQKEIISYDEKPGVLSPIMVVRAFYPILTGSQLVGVIEVSRTFDNAFVDFSKSRSDLDVTIYSGDRRSATTILTADGVSRWVGSKEINEDATEAVLVRKGGYEGVVDRLGVLYYSAFRPLVNVKDEIIGMVAVGVPTEVLLEDVRQELLSTFLLGSIISLLVAFIGYHLLKRYSQK